MRIKDLLKVEAIELGVSAANKEAAIDKLVALHDKVGNLADVEGYKAAILKRESESTTAIGEGLLKVLPYKSFLIKPNHHEISELFHDDVKKTDVELIEKYARKLQEMGAVNVLVSRGSKGATLVDETGAVNAEGIAKGNAINNVGCGDSMVAGFVAGYETKHDYRYALKLGSAAGGASAFNDGLAPGEQIWEVYHNCFEESGTSS